MVCHNKHIFAICETTILQFRVNVSRNGFQNEQKVFYCLAVLLECYSFLSFTRMMSALKHVLKTFVAFY